MNKKYLILLIVIVIILTAFAMAVAFNIGNLGTQLAGAGGPIAANLYNGLVGIPLWIASGGWPTLIAGVLIFTAIPALVLAYATWHYDLPYKITGATASYPSSGYDNSMSREPPEPERAPNISQPAVEKGR